MHTANAFHFVPYHGTPLRQVCLEKGYLQDDTRVEHNMKDTVLNMPQFPRDTIRGLVRTFMMYVRFPESEFPRIAEAEHLDDQGNQAFQELRQEFIERYFHLNTMGIAGSV
jgi:hypothetical protein